jgi:hypothetical protein
VEEGVSLGLGVEEGEGVSEVLGEGGRVGVGVGEGEVLGVEERELPGEGVGVEVGVRVGVREGVGEMEPGRQLSARMRWLLESPVYRVPAELTVTPTGLLKREAVP